MDNRSMINGLIEYEDNWLSILNELRPGHPRNHRL